MFAIAQCRSAWKRIACKGRWHSTRISPVQQLDQLHALTVAVNQTQSTTEKRALLSQFPSCHDILKRIYDPHLRHFISSKSVLGYLHCHETGPPGITTLSELLDILSSRRLTGHAALEATAAFYNTFCHTDAQKQVFWRVIDRNLKMGVSVRTVRHLLAPDTMPDATLGTTQNTTSTASKTDKAFMGVALAMPLKPGEEARLWSNYYAAPCWHASRKLDGVRCIALVTREKIRFYSRTGRLFGTLQKVEEEIRARSMPDCVLDGEICVYQDTKEDFLAALRQIRKLNSVMPDPVYEVFDCIDLNDFWDCKGDTPFDERQARLAAYIGEPQSHLRRVDQTRVDGMDALNVLRRRAIQQGWEGLILRNNVGYEGKRSRNMLKIKEWEDAEYRVKEIELGWMRMPDTGHDKRVMTNVIIEHKGNPVSVGSGFSLRERAIYAANPDLIVGKVITVRYFSESTGESGVPSLRFPTVKAIYDKEREM